MSSNLSTSRVLELLSQLKAALESFAGRADRLNSDLRTRVARERQLCERAVQEQREAESKNLEEANAAVAQAKTERERRHAARKDWIGRAYQNSKEAGLHQIEQSIGAKRYELQKRMLQAERDREGGYAQAAARLQDMRAALAAEHERLSALEGKARACFRGYGSLNRAFRKSGEAASFDQNRSGDELLTSLRELLAKADSLSDACSGPIPGAFRFLPLWIVLALVPFGIAAWQQQTGKQGLTYVSAGVIAGGILVFAFLGRMLATKSIFKKGLELASTLAVARKMWDACSANSEGSYTSSVEATRDGFQQISQGADQELKAAMAKAGQERVSCRMGADERAVRAGNVNDRQHTARTAALREQHDQALKMIKLAAETRVRALQEASETRIREMTAASDVEWGALIEEWQRTVPPIYDLLTSAHEAAERLFPPWQSMSLERWAPPKQFANVVRYGKLEVDVGRMCTAVPQDKRLPLPGPRQIQAPLCLTFPAEGTLILETGGDGREQAIGSLNNVVMRLLANTPPGRVNFTILDPVGLGQSFAGVMHMADFEEQIITNRIWTQPAQIEERLAELNEHMEKVIQMYLRNEYATIAEYNAQAGVIAEKYRFLVAADFPSGFTDSAARRLLSIAASGPRCGVFTLLHWDRRQTMGFDFPAADLRKAGICLGWKGAEFGVVGRALDGTRIALEAPPAAEEAIEFIQTVGKASKDSSRVEVPFEHVAPAEAQMWSEDTSSELRVAVGRTGATKLQYLAIGKGTRQHGLVAGKTGSGKSTLFHVMITNLSMWCSPEQVEFYLVDFKKGVEFKCYASKRLPHARVVAIESDREFGLSVLQRVDDELRRRGDMFRNLGVQDIPGYKRAGGAEPMPRCLLLIDEFQEFFVEDDKIAQTASMLLDRIVRQGRAFGIHVLLGSQTLGGAYTVARTTLGQMVIRIALQCNEADAYLIFDDDNPAPRLLSRPGEAIYNDAAGALEGNSPFQVVWLPDETRDRFLEKVRSHAKSVEKRYSGPIVFEGNAPSDIRENEEFSGLLNSATSSVDPQKRIWLGAPNSIKGPTEAVFARQSGNNLLIVGQRDEAVLAMFALGALALCAQIPKGAGEVLLVDSSAPGTPARDYLDAIASAAPRNLTIVRPGDLPAVMARLAAQKTAATASADPESGPTSFLLIHGLQRFPKLRFEEDFSFSRSSETEASPGAILNDLVSEGTRLGFHVVASCDTYNNVNRFLSRKALTEFEMRVVFQMSANDSASLIDSPRASTLGLHRALLFNAQEGYLEPFRPYALPPLDWLREAAAKIL